MTLFSKDMNPKEAAELAYLVLYATIDGMDGAKPETFRIDGYWDGSVETAARVLAFIFADTAYGSFDGIGTGDVVNVIADDLENGALHLMEDVVCSHCKRSLTGEFLQKRIDKAESCATSAAIKFFRTFADKDVKGLVNRALNEQREEREQSRKKQQARIK